MKRLAPILFLVITALPAFGADSNGEYMRGGGVGALPCPDFVEAMKGARKYKTGTLKYVNETQGFTMFLEGFRTGYNLSASDTYDIFPGKVGDDELLSRVENYCRETPESKFGDGVSALAKEAHPKRSRTALEK